MKVAIFFFFQSNIPPTSLMKQFSQQVLQETLIEHDSSEAPLLRAEYAARSIRIIGLEKNDAWKVGLFCVTVKHAHKHTFFSCPLLLLLLSSFLFLLCSCNFTRLCLSLVRFYAEFLKFALPILHSLCAYSQAAVDAALAPMKVKGGGERLNLKKKKQCIIIFCFVF